MRDMVQVSYRIRTLNDNAINACYLGRMNAPQTWVHDKKAVNCPIYNSLTNDILNEEKSPLRATFELFCSKANYKQKKETAVMNKELRDHINELLNEEIFCDYETIEEVTDVTAEWLQEKIYNLTSTVHDQMILKKHYLLKLFNMDKVREEKPKILGMPILGFIWKTRLIDYSMKLLQMQDDNIFHKIAKENNMVSFMVLKNDAYFRKLKLSPELRTEICKMFAFKFLNEKSNATALLKEIYNTYFGYRIVISRLEGKHCTYDFNDDMNQNLLLFCQNYKRKKTVQSEFIDTIDDGLIENEDEGV